MNFGNKAVVLHLHKTYSDVVENLRSVAEFYESVGELVVVKARDCVVVTTDAYIKFAVYMNYDHAKVNLLGGQYSHIYFHVDLPEQVKNHFLSRIRVHGVEYAEPKL